MRNMKRSLVSGVVSGVLGGVIGLTTFGGIKVEAKDLDNGQVTNSVAVLESEKQSEHFYKTKTGKCYHKEGCSCLSKSKIEVNNEEIEKADLKPCSKCCK